MSRAGILREVWRSGVAMSKVMIGSSLILSRHQAPHLSSASTSCSTILSSHFQPCRRVRQSSSHTIRNQRRQVLLLDNELQNGSFCVKHVPSSLHGHIKVLKQLGPWPKEKHMDAFNLYPTRKPKRTVDVQHLNVPLDESHPSPGTFPSLVTQLPTALEPQFPSATLDQSKTRVLNGPGNLEQSTSSSTKEVVPLGSKAGPEPVHTVSTIAEHRRSRRAEKWTSDQQAPSPNSVRPGPGCGVSYMLGKQPLPRSSNRIASSNSYPNSSKQVEAGVESKIGSHQVISGIESRQQNTDSLKVELEQVDDIKANLTRRIIANDVQDMREPKPLSKEEEGRSLAASEERVTENSVGQDLRTEELLRTARGLDGRSTPSGMRPGLNLIAQGRLQSRASYGSKDWSGDAAQGNGSTHMHSAGTASQAITVLKNRLQRGITVDSYMYVDVLRRCSEQKDLSAAKQVHDCIIQSGMDKKPYVARSLLNTYIQCGELLDARRVFDEIHKKTIVTWTKMIAGYAKYDHAESAFEIFNQMRQEGLRPDAITYLSILKACASPLALKWGKEVHVCIRQAGLQSDVRVGTALLTMYAKCGCITEARRVFENLTNRDVVTWTVMIGALAQHGCGHEAYRLFLQMKREGFQPNAFTYASILNTPASAGALEWVKEVHGHARKAGLELDLRVGSALVHMYAESGNIDDARLVFDRMEKSDLVTWNIMIGGLAQHGCGHEALELFKKMNAHLIKPNGSTFVAVLSACCHGGLVDDGRKLFLAMTQDYGIQPDIVHYTCMVDLLGRAGHLEEAQRFISDMPVEPNGVTWTALLGACRTYCNVELGELAAKELLKLEPDDASAYVLLSNIYAASGKWEKVSLVRTIMKERGVRKEPGCSWIEVDKKIHEFVVGDTSHPEAEAIYIELNKLTENLKAEGYIPDTRFVLHDINEEEKELALCSHSEKLAIAYGLIHIPREEPIRVRKNLRVCPDCHTATKFISKVTGREIIARDANRFHHFKDGMCSCGDYW